MPFIRPISDLRNNFNKISEICHQEAEPVFITKNGQGNMVVMSMALYEKQQALLELYQKLSVAESQSQLNEPKISHKELISKLRSNLNE
ncbi:type II toxin-antitoxin system Phd/YefM family antitoxin [Sporosalibacterium faouarense]|uniref:type II toxin-antitoxin system Phd/YefM family antitoxin n=1 Tax=Sporosalibacterium faouarense TaxID=516123 RepID=UPI00141C09AC|nr:type II toxin-antitoxin system Phd/YefM family antitoxin [Sporosalibacterium faouarense]MTI49900.1 type II toxin-antitoxin system Phd/YefM family antitoxin [Bacillota bacterium]